MVNRKIIKIDENLCTGCGDCIIACAEGALEIIDGKAKVIRESFCDGLGACIGECPEGALSIEERKADDFDEAAVKEHLEEMKKSEHMDSGHHSHDGEVCCPSARPQILGSESRSHEVTSQLTAQSQLGHWPVQLMLVPETAPFLKGEELVVLADCVAVAYPNLHKDFVKGKTIVMGCPKFDNIEIYRKKLKNIIQHSGISGISVVHMEVPCCSGLEMIVSEAVNESNQKIPYRKYVIGLKGDIIE